MIVFEWLNSRQLSIISTINYNRVEQTNYLYWHNTLMSYWDIVLLTKTEEL